MENDKEEKLSPLEEAIDIIEYNKSIEEAIKTLKLKCSLTPNPEEKKYIRSTNCSRSFVPILWNISFTNDCRSSNEF